MSGPSEGPTTPEPTLVQITLRDVPDPEGDAPGMVRLRRVLKLILRGFRWRAVRVEALATPEGDSPADAILYDLEAIHE
jgi:hypothetical protein